MYPTFSLQKSLTCLQSTLLDWVAAIFALPLGQCDTDVRRVDLILHNICLCASQVDAELAELATIEDADRLLDGEDNQRWRRDFMRQFNREDMSALALHRLTPSLISKRFEHEEVDHLEFVRQNTTIPVPRIHQAPCGWPVMDFIEGEMLCLCWDRLSPLMQFRVACTMRLYVKQLRGIKRDTVGRLKSGRVGGLICEWGEYDPFETAGHFARFCEYITFSFWRAKRVPVAPGGIRLMRPQIDWTPVFTHGDLNSSNILLDRRGTLWILDWGTAGFYPRSMESFCTSVTDDSCNLAPSWYRRYHRFVYDSNEEEYAFWAWFHANMAQVCSGTIDIASRNYYEL